MCFSKPQAMMQVTCATWSHRTAIFGATRPMPGIFPTRYAPRAQATIWDVPAIRDSFKSAAHASRASSQSSQSGGQLR